MVNAGVVDHPYQGEVKVLLVNISPISDYNVEKHARIAQVILEKIMDECEIVEVEELETTTRGEGGFGSTEA